MIDLVIGYYLASKAKFARTPAELQGENFAQLYAGQDRVPGSKSGNDQLRKEIGDAGFDLSKPIRLQHFAEQRVDLTPTKSEEVLAALNGFGFKPVEGTEPKRLDFERTDKTTSMIFDRNTSDLNDYLYEHGWR
ncbi:MAG: hypothetical protein ACPG5U_04505, partial [Planktomarina sp.]